MCGKCLQAECKDSGQVLRENKALLRQSNLKDFEILNYKRQLEQLNRSGAGSDRGEPPIMEIPEVQRGGGAATVDVEVGGTDGTGTSVHYHPGAGGVSGSVATLRSIPVGGGKGRRNSAPVRMRSNSLW